MAVAHLVAFLLRVFRAAAGGDFPAQPVPFAGRAAPARAGAHPFRPLVPGRRVALHARAVRALAVAGGQCLVQPSVLSGCLGCPGGGYRAPQRPGRARVLAQGPLGHAGCQPVPAPGLAPCRATVALGPGPCPGAGPGPVALCPLAESTAGHPRVLLRHLPAGADGQPAGAPVSSSWPPACWAGRSISSPRPATTRPMPSATVWSRWPAWPKSP